MKEIKLTQGKVALVDDADYDWLNQWKWHVSEDYHQCYYACRSGNKKNIKMHREILGLKYQDKRHSDHIDGNGLNNQRINLRVCSCQQNQFNRKMQSNNKSGYIGVWYYKKTNKWRADSRLDGKTIFLGLFINKNDAARAYNNFVSIHHGEFARLNIIKEDIK